MKETVSKSNVNLQPHQEELIYLAELAGIKMDQKVFRIIVELLNMQVEPEAIYTMLKLIVRSKSPRHLKSSRKSSGLQNIS